MKGVTDKLVGQESRGRSVDFAALNIARRWGLEVVSRDGFSHGNNFPEN